MFRLLQVGIVRDASSMHVKIFERAVGRGVGNGTWRFGISLFWTSALARTQRAYLEGNTSGNVNNAVVESSLLVSFIPPPTGDLAHV